MIARRVLRKAVRAGAAPQVKEAKRNAPRRTGLLKRAITNKVKQYRRGAYVLAVIGVNRRRKDAQGRDAWYSHLLEGGARPHAIPTRRRAGKLLRYEVGGVAVYRHRVHHPGTRATRFLERSYRAKKQESLARFRSKFVVEVVAEAKKA